MPENVASTSAGLNAAEIYRRDAAGVVVVTATAVPVSVTHHSVEPVKAPTMTIQLRSKFCGWSWNRPRPVTHELRRWCWRASGRCGGDVR